MTTRALLILVFLLALSTSTTAVLVGGYPASTISNSQLQTIAAAIDAWIANSTVVSTASLVRLSFHDCVGGCDGCINVTNPDNNGLNATASALTNFWNTYSAAHPVRVFDHNMTRADFWALAGMRAAAIATANVPSTQTVPVVVVPPINFRIGRTNCLNGFNSDERESEGTFPSGISNWTAVLGIFGPGGFGFTDRQIVALLGAHALGGLVPKNSGFQGQWVLNPGRLDNSYYRTMTNASNNYQNVPVETSQFGVLYQWNATIDATSNRVQRIMLNTDMSLLKSFVASPITGQV